MGAKGLLHVMQYLDIARVIEIVQAQHLFHLHHALFGEIGGFGLFVDGEIPCVTLPFSGKRIGFLLNHLPLLQRGNDAVDHVVFVRALLRGAGDDERGAGLIHEDGVHLVHNGVVVLSLDIIGKAELHVVPEVVEAELVVRAVGYIGIVGLPALVVVQPVDDNSH